MLPPPVKPRDPLAMAFLAVVAVLLVIGVVLGVRALLSQPTQRQVQAQPATGPSFSALRQSIQHAAEGLMARLRPVTPQPPTPQPPTPRVKSPAPAQAPVAPATGITNDPQRVYPTIKPLALPHVLPVPVNAGWTYDVFSGPTWQKSGKLHYQALAYPTQGPDHGKPGVTMSWIPNGGQTSSWFIGIVEADHASHANTRFPGFFMHPAYFPQTLAPGARLLWEFPWQGGDARRKGERVRRYDMKVIGWEHMSLPAGEFDAVRMEGSLRYVDADSIKAEVAYTLWYAPRARQIVRLRWIGRAPDEANAEMIAELVAHRVP